MAFQSSVDPSNVNEIINKHLIADGYDIIIDLQKSHGLTMIDARNGDEYLDFYSFLPPAPWASITPNWLRMNSVKSWET